MRRNQCYAGALCTVEVDRGGLPKLTGVTVKIDSNLM
jgi:hypothetical protein